MRLRLPELLEQRGLSGYQLAKRARGRLSLSTVYRLLRNRGRFDRITADHLAAFCDVLDVGPGELLDRRAVRRSGPHQRLDGAA